MPWLNSASSSPDFKFSAAAAVDPNTIPASSPGTSLDAWGITTLAHQTYSSANPFTAPVAFHVSRFTVDGLNIISAIAVASSTTLSHCAKRYQDRDECNSY
jgi:hypothetical protein